MYSQTFENISNAIKNSMTYISHNRKAFVYSDAFFLYEGKRRPFINVLQALNEQGEYIIPSTLSHAEVNGLRTQSFYCPQCEEKVIIRAGPKVIPHFSHLPESACEFVKGGESNYHKRAKLLLYDWLKRHSFLSVTLEQYLPQINQRPDILIETSTRKIAVEFQSATISSEEIHLRNSGYAKENIIPLWVLGENQLVRNRPFDNSFQINTFIQSLIKRHVKNSPTYLIYFCPNKKQFIILNDLYVIRANYVLATRVVLHIDNIRLRHLFPQRLLSKRQLFNHWSKEKKRFRLSSYRVHGKELKFRKWLYQQRLHVEQLPSVIHLPIRSQYKMNAPLWHWQSKLVINVLNPISVGSTIELSMCMKEIDHYMNKQYTSDSHEVIKEYFIYLTKVRLFEKINDFEWIKMREFRFHRYIEESLEADKLLLKYLQKYP